MQILYKKQALFGNDVVLTECYFQCYGRMDWRGNHLNFSPFTPAMMTIQI